MVKNGDFKNIIRRSSKSLTQQYQDWETLLFDISLILCDDFLYSQKTVLFWLPQNTPF